MPTENPQGFVRAPLAADDHRDPEKVLGLGAPTSMAITIHPCEAAALAEATRAELAAYERRSARDERGWTDHIGELRAMLDDINARHQNRQFEVIWPEVLAGDVVHRALRLAVDRAHTITTAGGDAQAIAPALAAAAAALRTARAYDAVDLGGRQDVWL